MAASPLRRSIGVLVALAFATALATAPVGAASNPAIPLPVTMAAVGDSITQAASTGGGLGTDYPANSWATGTNAAVNSHLLRLRGLAPAVTATNMSVSGAKVAGLEAQMLQAVALQPDYLTVLIGGNDICTSSEATMTSVVDFRAQFEAAMATISTGSPTTHVYVVSIPRVLRLWELFKGNWWARTVWSLGNVCQSLLARPTSTTQSDVDRRARVHLRNIDFNAVLAEVCGATPRCHWDGNAAFNTVFQASDVSGDYFHPSTAGQAKLASVSWGAGYTWATPPGGAPQVRVGGLVGSGQNVSSRNWRATVQITATTPAGAPVAGATITGTWTIGAADICTTGASGTCAVQSDNLRRSSVSSVTFTVGGVTHATHAYVPGANQVNAVTVARP